MLDEKTIQTAVQRVVAAAHSPVKVILFGSYARGDADEGSDLDLIVVEKEIPDYTDEYLRLRNTLGPLYSVAHIEAFVADPEESLLVLNLPEQR